MDRTIAILTLAGALLACHTPEVVAWEPASTRMNGTPLTKRALQIGPADVGAVRKAGGLPLGTLSMKGGDDLNELTDAAATQAAALGGTHFMLGRWSEQTSTDYVGSGNGKTWSIVPVTSTARNANFVVIRVPKSGWDHLDDALMPSPIGDEK